VFDDDEPYENPHGIDDEVYVHGTLFVLDGQERSRFIEHEGVTVRIVQTWWDDDVGWRYGGVPVDPAFVDEVRRQFGTEVNVSEMFFNEHGTERRSAPRHP